MAKLERTSALLVTSLRRSEESRAKLESELQSLRDLYETQSERLEASATALQRAKRELASSQDSLRLADESLRRSARSAWTERLLLGAGAVGVGLLAGLLID